MRTVVESHGFEGNIRNAFFLNLKALGAVFRRLYDVLRSVASGTHDIDGTSHYVAVGSAVARMTSPAVQAASFRYRGTGAYLAPHSSRSTPKQPRTRA